MFQSQYRYSSALLPNDKWKLSLWAVIKILFNKNFEEALQMTDQMLGLYGPRHCIYMLRRQAQRGLGRYSDAEVSHKAALAAGVQCIPMANRARELGNEHFALNELAKASDYYVLGITYDACDMRLQLNISALNLKKMAFAVAETSARLALQLGIVFEAPRPLLYKAIARYVAAHQGLHGHSPDKRPSWESSYRRRIANIGDHNTQNFIEDRFPRAITLDVEHNIAIALAMFGMFEAATTHFTTSIALSPNEDVWTLIADRAICYMRQSKFRDGLQDALNAVRRSAKPEAHAQWLVGLCWFGLGNFANAQRELAKATVIDSSNSSYAACQRWSSAAEDVFFDTVVQSLTVSMPKKFTY